MGTTFSTIQIKNSMRAAPEPFKESLCGYFEKKGLIPATEEDFQFSYRLAFSDKSEWVTLSLPEYEPGAQCVHADAEGIAKALKTHCIATSVVDSDMILLELFGTMDTQRDTIMAGSMAESEFDEEDFPGHKGKPILWIPLLTEGATWEQFSGICNGDYTHAEDTLADIAPLLGMDPKNVTSDYNAWDGAGNNPNVVDIYLKKASSGKRALSLNAAFKQVFGETLEPLGFVKLKGKHPYFVRLIGDEILHVIALTNEYTSHPHWKGFDIFGGVATVYRNRITLEKNPKDNLIWLKALSEFYSKLNYGKHGDAVWKSLCSFSYDPRHDQILLRAMTRALEATKQYMLPMLNKVTSLEACVEHFYTFHSPMLNISGKTDFDKEYRGNDYNEGLLLIKTNNRDDGVERTERMLAEIARLMQEGRMGGTQKDFEEMCEIARNGRVLQIAIRDKIFNDPALCAKVSAELERRKTANLEILRSYGLDL